MTYTHTTLPLINVIQKKCTVASTTRWLTTRKRTQLCGFSDIVKSSSRDLMVIPLQCVSPSEKRIGYLDTRHQKLVVYIRRACPISVLASHSNISSSYPVSSCNHRAFVGQGDRSPVTTVTTPPRAFIWLHGGGIGWDTRGPEVN